MSQCYITQGVTQTFWEDDVLNELGKYKRLITLPERKTHFQHK